MTIIKQKAVSSPTHAKNLRAYINDKAALARAVRNVYRREAWFKEMAEEREAAGHDKAARGGAKNTVMFHQVLAFLPEECSCNGGPMTPERCMEYAMEWLESRYPDQQAALALHKEHCAADGTDRYAVHMAINRTNLATGRRLDEGRSRSAKAARAKAVRAMDARWGLKQVERDAPNSKLHRQQPRGFEKKIAAEGGRPYKANLRGLCRFAAQRSTDMEGFRGLLESWGVDARVRKGRVYVTDRDNARYEFSLLRLDNALTSNALRAAWEKNAANPAIAATEKEIIGEYREAHRDEKRREWMESARKRYAAYRKSVRGMEGAPMADIPRVKLPRPPEWLMDDGEVRDATLAFLRGGDALRRKMACGDSASAQQPAAGRKRAQRSIQRSAEERRAANRRRDR